jgi:hypothetical protein
MVCCNELRTDGGSQDLTAALRPANPDESRLWGASPSHDRHVHGASMSGERARMKLALVPIATANRGGMCVFSQGVLPIEPQVSWHLCHIAPGGSHPGPMALSECVGFEDHIDAGRGPSH